MCILFFVINWLPQAENLHFLYYTVAYFSMKLIDLLESNLSLESDWGHNHFLFIFGKTEQIHNMNYFHSKLQFFLLVPFWQKWLFLSLTQSCDSVDFIEKSGHCLFFLWSKELFCFFVVASCRRTLLLARPAGFFKTLKSTHFLPSLWKTFNWDKRWAYL